jgi:hypothetical protein
VPPAEVITLVTLLAQSTVLAACLILGPLARFARQGLHLRGRWGYLTYFAGLGLGFIMIEIVMLQRFTLFLGQPVYTFAAILASLLIFTGTGSYVAGRVTQASPTSLAWVVVAIIAILWITTLITPPLFAASIGFSMPWRVTIAIAMVAPSASSSACHFHSACALSPMRRQRSSPGHGV